MQIAFSGTYTPQHLVKVGGAMQRISGGGGLIQRAGFLGIVAVALVVIPIAAALGGAPSSVLGWIPIGIIAFALIAFNEWGVRRGMAKGTLASQPVSGTIGEDGVDYVLPDSSSHFSWRAFRDFVPREDYLLLWLDTNRALALARDFFATPADYESAIALVKQHVVPQRRPLLAWKSVFRLVVWMVVILTIFLLWALFRTTQGGTLPR
jgi:hypothetical protein